MLLILSKSYNIEKTWASPSWHPREKSWINRMREQGSLHRGHPALCLHQGFLQHSVSSAAQLGALWVHCTKLTQQSKEVTPLCVPTGIFQAGLCLMFYSGGLSPINCVECLEHMKYSETGNVGGTKVVQLLEKKGSKMRKVEYKQTKFSYWIFNSTLNSDTIAQILFKEGPE